MGGNRLYRTRKPLFPCVKPKYLCISFANRMEIIRWPRTGKKKKDDEMWEFNDWKWYIFDVFIRECDIRRVPSRNRNLLTRLVIYTATLRRWRLLAIRNNEKKEKDRHLPVQTVIATRKLDDSRAIYNSIVT